MKKWIFLLVATLLPISSAAAGEPELIVAGDRHFQPVATEKGIASWYGGRFIGGKTANGERYHPEDLTAAHRKLPFNTKVRVTNLENGHQVVVRINNRGPFIQGRIIDLSVRAAEKLKMKQRGLVKVKVEILEPLDQGTAQKNSTEIEATPSRPSRSRLLATRLR